MMTCSVKMITDDILCCACGGCSGICPKKAISMKYTVSGFLIAKLDESKCVNCGICLNVCPSLSNEHPNIHKEVHAALCGHAADPAIWKEGQSGGAGTAILLQLLRSSIVDGAVVSKLIDGIPKTVYTEDPEVIRSAAGSVYAQTSVVETVLKHRDKKMAVVCLGCQAKAIRKAAAIVPGLSDRVIIIGLICGGNMSLMMKDDLMHQMHAKEGVFRYRDKKNTGWPGDPSCETKSGIKTVDKAERMKLKPLYEPYRCITCPDKMNTDSDILLGDPWGIPEDEKPEGMSVILSYTRKGMEILQQCNEKVLITHEINEELVRKGQNEEGIARRLKDLVRIAQEEGYRLPFEMLTKANQQYNKELAEQVRFARKLYNARDRKEAGKLVRKKKNSIEKPLIEALYALKQSFFEKK